MARAKRKKPVASLRVPIAVFVGCVAIVLASYWMWQRSADVPSELGVPGCQSGPTVPGIDVSYYQESIAWPRVRRAGIRYAFIRVSDGLTISDGRFAQNWRNAKQAGLLRGAYQYFRPDQSALAQADLLIEAIDHDPGELPPVIDVETTGGKSAREIAAATRIWIDRVRSRLGVEPIVYTGPDFWRTQVVARAMNRDSADLTTQPLWIAHYTSDCPTVPAPWQRWTFWQHSDRGRVPGITGYVDLDLFSGSFKDLQEFARRSRLPR